MIQQTKELRKRIDGLIQYAHAIKEQFTYNPMVKDKELNYKLWIDLANAWNELRLAKAWLGKVLETLEEPNPYPAVDSVDKIPPTTDVAEPTKIYSDLLKNINSLRASIDLLVCTELKELTDALSAAKNASIAEAILCKRHLQQARFYYGFALGTMRDQNKEVQHKPYCGGEGGSGNQEKASVSYVQKCIDAIKGGSRVGELSDGYHTFNELYEHRCLLWLALVRLMPYEAKELYQKADTWKSKLHNDGSSYDGWFVLGVTLYNEQKQPEHISYHLPIKWWDKAQVQELDRARYDGHTSQDVLERIEKYLL